MNFTTNQLVDILETYEIAENEGVATRNPNQSDAAAIQKMVEEELRKRGYAKRCRQCGSHLYEGKEYPTHNHSTFCRDQCKENHLRYHQHLEA